MALFKFVKKEEEEKTSCCCAPAAAPVQEAQSESCCCGGTSEEVKTETSCCCNGGECSIQSIKVLGAGCKSCHEQYQNVIDAVAELGIATDVQYITDMEKVMAYGVMSMPAVVVNEKVVSMGKVLKSADVINLLKKLGYC